MFTKAVLIGVFFAATAASPAFAQSFGVGVVVGGPVYYEGQILGRALPLAPDAIFDALERAGYREFSPMAPHEPIYRLNAVNPRGDLVALEISMFTGAIERERVLALHQRPPLRVYRSGPPPLDAPPPPPAYEDGERNPLVVY